MHPSERVRFGVKKAAPQGAASSHPRLTTRPSDGVIEARDGHGRLLAHFNPRTHETRDARGDLLGHGNLLPRLLQHPPGRARP